MTVTFAAESEVDPLTAGTSSKASALGISGENIKTDNGLRGLPSSETISTPPELVPLNAFAGSERSYNFNANWKFYLGEANNASAPSFLDSSWRDISLPHDYSIEQDYNQSNEAESGYLPGGIGWYRKTFQLSPDWQDRVMRLDFGGAYMDATIWINGHELGIHPYGYTPFSFDITPYLNFDQPNIIAVRTDNKIPSSRWYSGSGIYRDVTLTVMDSVHVALYGNVITTPDLQSEYSQGQGVVKVESTIENQSLQSQEIQLRNTIIKKGTTTSIVSNETIKKTIPANSSEVFADQLAVPNPSLWGVKDPHLYIVKTEVINNDVVVDNYESDFGFRWTVFDADTGFSLNGEPVKLKGVCMHHDQGALGSAAYYRAQERQVDILLEMGTNAIRVTHNPASDDLVKICNEKGMLLIDEAFDTWVEVKNGNRYDYARWFEVEIESDNEVLFAEPDMTWAEFDIKAMVRRGQNAPSIIMWSLGNEVLEGTANAQAGRYPAIVDQLIDWTLEVDDTRPTTTGENKLKANNPNAINMANILTAKGGTVGFNYTQYGQLDTYHANNPDWLMYGAETASAINSRGIYKNKGNGGQVAGGLLSAYDQQAVGWGARASDSWYNTITKDYYAGEFVWTGFDYLGEPTPWNGIGSGSVGSWPAPKSSYFGIIDTAGLPKDTFYFYQSQWNDDVNTLHILPAWNEEVVQKDGSGKVEVVVYSDAAKVELFLHKAGEDTATSLGEKKFNTVTTPLGYTYQMEDGKSGDKSLFLTWQVPYADGVLYAKAYDAAGIEITGGEGISRIVTSGAPKKIELSADRTNITANGEDLSYITVDICDENGNIVPYATDEITFAVAGEGELVALDNGSQVDHTPYQADFRKVLAGKLVAIVRSTTSEGSFTLTATGSGLESENITVTTTANQQGGQYQPVSYIISKNHYIQKGAKPTLPATVEVKYTDDSTAVKAIIWDTSYLNDGTLDILGTHVISGKIEDLNLFASVSLIIIEEIATVLNYSTVIPVGGTPILPATRPAVVPNGTVIDVDFPVIWSTFSSNDFSQAGVVEVDGQADIMGNSLPVKAFIRVADEDVTIGSNVAPLYLHLEQSVPTADQSDTLLALVDKSTLLDPNLGGGPNPSAWSNYAYSQKGEDTADIMIDFATAQNIGEMKLHFFTDTYATELPDKIEIYYTLSGIASDDWRPMTFTQSIGAANGRVTPYTLSFAPISAEGFKISVTNKAGFKPGTTSRYHCVGMTELELFTATGNIQVSSSDEITEMIVNGVTVSQSALDAREYSTAALIADIEAKSEHNAAITILPAYENTINIITESEDGTKRGKYQIELDSAQVITPGDDSKDYTYTQTTPTSASAQSQSGKEGPIAFSTDNDPTTYWHTQWNQNLANRPDDRWLMLTLDETITVEGLRYLPRPTIANGIVTKYRIEVSEDNTEWNEVATGSWAHDSQWKIATFTPVKAKYVKLYGVETKGGAGDALNQYMSAAEVRVQQRDTSIQDLSSATVIFDSKAYMFTGSEIKPIPRVELNGQDLRYGLDYRVVYTDNIQVGTATAVVSGIIKYEGSVSETFTIEEAPGSIMQSVLPVGDITVPAGTPFTGIQGLPQQVLVELADNSQISVDVNWAKPANYDENISETYKSIGTLVAPAGIINPQNLTAEVNIIVTELVVAIHSITVFAPSEAIVKAPTDAQESETVAFKVTIVDAQYMIDAVKLNPIGSIKDNGGGNYSFQMPSEDVEIIVTTKLKPAAEIYKITLDLPSGIGGSVNPTSSEPGKTVLISLNGEKLAQVQKIILSTGGEVEKVKDGEYSFVMPESNVTVKVSISDKGISPDPDPETGGTITIPSDDRSSASTGSSKADASPNLLAEATATDNKLNENVGKTLFNRALSAQKGSETVLIRAYNYKTVSAQGLKEIAALAKASGVKALVCFDTVVNDKVVYRVKIDPALVTANISVEKLSICDKLVVLFNKHYSNEVEVIGFTQPEYKGTGELAIKPKIANTANLKFYDYNALTNTYTEIKGVQYKVDSNGYVHFVAKLNSITVISDGGLNKI